MVAKPRNTGQEWEPGDLTQTRASTPTPTPTTTPTPSLLKPKATPVGSTPSLKPVARPVGESKTNLVGGKLKAPVTTKPKVDMSGGERALGEVKSAFKTAALFVPALGQFVYGLGKDVLVENTLESVANLTPGFEYKATPETFDDVTKSFATTVTSNPIRRYKEAYDAGYPLFPMFLEDIGNISLVGYGFKIAARGGGIAAAEAGTKAAAAGQTGRAAGYANVAGKAEQFSQQAGRFATATDKLAAIPIIAPFKAAGFIARERRTGAYGQRFSETTVGSKLMPEGPLYGMAAYNNSLQQLADLRAAEPDISMNDPRLVALNDRATKAWRSANRYDLRRWLRRAVRYERNEADLVQRTMLDATENPLYKDEMGPLSDVEQQVVVSLFNGTAPLIKWFNDNTALSVDKLTTVGRYDFLPGYSLSPQAIRMAVQFLSPDGGGLDVKQVERIVAAADTLQEVVRQATQKAIEGEGRRAALSPEYLVPTPLSQNLEANIIKYVDETGDTTMLDEWESIKAEGILDLDVNDPVRMQTLQSFVRSLPERYALDHSMYPASMRPMIAFYKRLRTALEREARGDVEGEPLPPYDRPPLGPDEAPMPPRKGKFGATERLVGRLRKAVDQIAVAIVKKTEQIAKLEEIYEKNVEVVFKYKITDEFVRGATVEELAARSGLPEARILEILDPKKNKVVALFNRAKKAEATAEAMRAELGVGLRMIDVTNPQAVEARANMEAEYQRLTDEAEALRAEILEEQNRLREDAKSAAMQAEDAMEGIGRADEELDDLEDQYEDAGRDPEDVFNDPEILEQAAEPMSDGARQVLENERDGLLKRVEELKAEEARLQGTPEAPAAAVTAIDEDAARKLVREAQRTKIITEAIWRSFTRLIVNEVTDYKPNRRKSVSNTTEKRIFEAAKRDVRKRGIYIGSHNGRLWWTDGYVIGPADEAPILGSITEPGRYVHDSTKRAGVTVEFERLDEGANVGAMIDQTANRAKNKITLRYQFGDVVVGEFGDGQTISISKNFLEGIDDGTVEFFAEAADKPILIKRGDDVVGVVMPNPLARDYDLSAPPDLATRLDLATLAPQLVLDATVTDKAASNIFKRMRPMFGLGTKFRSPFEGVGAPKTTSSVTRLKTVQRDIGASEARLSQIDAELAADAEARLAPVEAAITRAEEAVRRVDEITERDRQMFERHRGWANYYDDDNLQIPAEQFGVLVDEKNQLIDEYGELQRVRLNREQPDQWPEPENVNRFIDADDRFIASRQSEIESRLIDLERQINEATAEPSEARLAPVEAAATAPTQDTYAVGQQVGEALKGRKFGDGEFTVSKTTAGPNYGVGPQAIRITYRARFDNNEANFYLNITSEATPEQINATLDEIENRLVGGVERQTASGSGFAIPIRPEGFDYNIAGYQASRGLKSKRHVSTEGIKAAIDALRQELARVTGEQAAPGLRPVEATPTPEATPRSAYNETNSYVKQTLNTAIKQLNRKRSEGKQSPTKADINKFVAVVDGSPMQQFLDELDALAAEIAAENPIVRQDMDQLTQIAEDTESSANLVASFEDTIAARQAEKTRIQNDLRAAIESYVETYLEYDRRVNIKNESPTGAVVSGLQRRLDADIKRIEKAVADLQSENALIAANESRIAQLRGVDVDAVSAVRRVEAVRPDPVITDPGLKAAAYVSDVLDSLAPRLAAKMDEAQTIQERMTAFQEYLDAANRAIEMTREAQTKASTRLVKAERQQEARLARIDKRMEELQKLLGQSVEVEAAIERAENSEAYRVITQVLTDSLPIDLALDPEFFQAPFGMYAVDLPGGPIETVGPIYLPTGFVPEATGATKMREIRPGTEGWRDLTSSHFKQGERQIIADFKKIGLRMGSEAAQISRNETWRLLLATFAKKVGDFLPEEVTQQMYQDAYNRALNYDPERIQFEDVDLFAEMEAAGLTEVRNGVAAYAPGNANPRAVFEMMVRNLYGKAIREQMQLRGFQVADPFRSIDYVVRDTDITHESLFVPLGFKEEARRVTQPVGTGRMDRFIDYANKVTQGFKTGTLALSVTWQLGDLISSLIIAQMTGVNVPTMINRMKQVVDAEYGGGFERSMVDPNADLPTPTRLGRVLQESPVQDLSLAQAERERIMGVTPQERPKPRLLMRPFRKVADISYRINETINRIARHAYYLELLERELASRNINLDQVVEDRSLLNDPALREVLFETADTANKWLGDFANLDSTERRYVTPLIPFYSWTKHIHKVFVALGQEHPQSIRWYLTIGAMYFDPEEDPMNLRNGLRVLGGYAGTGFLNPLGDVLGGPIAQALTGQGFGGVGQMLGPIPRFIAGAADVDVTSMGSINRPVGTGVYGETGNRTYGGILASPQDFLGFSAQQFPIAQRTLSALPALNLALPGDPIPENIPGTRIALGPVARYQTGEARTKPGFGQQRIEQPGGELAAVGRLFSLPFIPYRSEQQIRDIELSARQRLRTLESIRRQRDILGPP